VVPNKVDGLVAASINDIENSEFSTELCADFYLNGIQSHHVLDQPSIDAPSFSGTRNLSHLRDLSSILGFRCRHLSLKDEV
jgi:hypothetical protein